MKIGLSILSKSYRDLESNFSDRTQFQKIYEVSMSYFKEKRKLHVSFIVLYFSWKAFLQCATYMHILNIIYCTVCLGFSKSLGKLVVKYVSAY